MAVRVPKVLAAACCEPVLSGRDMCVSIRGSILIVCLLHDCLFPYVEVASLWNQFEFIPQQLQLLSTV